HHGFHHALALASLSFGCVKASLDTRAANPQIVSVKPQSFAVLGTTVTSRDGSICSTPPTRRSRASRFRRRVLRHIGDDTAFPRDSDPTFGSRTRRPVGAETDEVWFASTGRCAEPQRAQPNNQVGKISLKDVAAAILKNGTHNVNVTTQGDLPDTVQMTNGSLAWNGSYKARYFMNQGRGNLPANIVLVDPHTERDLPLQSKTGAVRVVTDGINKPNGLTFSHDYKHAFIADTGVYGGLFPNNGTLPATIYKYDVEEGTLAFINRRTFAYADSGAADGVGVDTKGNVYGGCGDGVHVWNKDGVLLGKFLVGSNTANFAFASDGRLVIMGRLPYTW
ncbi:hypothetical protein B0H17DRAFT_1058436, partial [Mycena rosella]